MDVVEWPVCLVVDLVVNCDCGVIFGCMMFGQASCLKTALTWRFGLMHVFVPALSG